MKILLALPLIALLGCGPAVFVGEKFVLNNKVCQSAEVSLSMSSKQVPTICKDENGNWQLVATAGRPGGQILSDGLRAAATVGLGLVVADAFGDIETGSDFVLGIPGQ